MCTDRAITYRDSRGFSLIEMIVFIVIVGVALAGTLSVLNLTVASSADPLLAKQAAAVGEAFIDEILSRDYTQSCSCATRSQFLGVLDYNLYNTTGILTRSGTPIAGLGNYKVRVDVTQAAADLGPAGNQVPTTDLKVITVTVTDPANRTYPFVAYKSKY